MDFLEPEAEIVARLKDQLGVEVKVESYPNAPETYDFTAPRGAVLVRYNASRYAPPVPNRKAVVVQDRTAEWTVTLLHRSLAGHEGVYALLEAVREALTGFTPSTLPAGTVLYPTRDGFKDRTPGKWAYEIAFAHTVAEAEDMVP